MQDGPGTNGEHGARPHGWLSADMSTIQDIDREAARRVAMALGEDEHRSLEEEGADDAAPAWNVEAAGELHTRQRASRLPHPATQLWPFVPRMLALAAIVAGITVLLQIAGNPGHGSLRVGSLKNTGTVAPVDPQGALTMKSKIRRPIAVAAVTAATTTANAQQPVQWRLEDGGNGHWYEFEPSLVDWQAARANAVARGGDLASLASATERAFWMAMIPVGSGIPGCPGCTWLGGYQDPTAPDYAEPAGGWRWSDGTPWTYTFWNSGEPNNQSGANFLYASGPTNGRWDDSTGQGGAPSIIEWSADCNNDGIVDYGQILSGQLADADANGVPDACECTCDVFRDNTVNGIDLGVLLGQWGEVTQYTVTDFNRDGAVDGSDLGQLLAAWGPCPN
ncbi:MAG: hypothetical protein FGM39_10810 [Phycisphaerales bacterium]|nr:hypothetical protein [Phycisphaerales bacterium]